LRIALVNNFFLPRLSGSAHLTKVLASKFAELGHEVLVITSAQDSPVGFEDLDGYRILRLKCRELPETRLSMRYDVNFAFSLKNYRIISKELDEFRPDVLHQHGQFFDLTWMTSIWSQRNKIPLVLTVHTPLIHPSTLLGGIFWIADQLIVRPFLALNPRTVLVVDRFMRNYVSRRYRLRDSEIINIPLAIDVEKFYRRSNSSVRDKYKLGADPIILSIGHVIPLRNRIALVEAMPEILQRHPSVKVLIVGDILDERFVERAKELGVFGALRLIGPVPHDEISDFFAVANVEVHDLQGYGLGTSTLEVMASEVPVVAVVKEDNFPGISFVNKRDLVMVGLDDTAALANAVCSLIEDPEFARQIGSGARKFIEENLSSTRIAKSHLELYESLIK
jgi:1,2-diacylglycerol 3-alpha-glucosyltransferase